MAAALLARYLADVWRGYYLADDIGQLVARINHGLSGGGNHG